MYPTIENGTTVLHADEGMRLTDGSSFVTIVRLGKEDTGESWYEITEEEAQERMDQEISSDDEAAEADYQAALREFGVKV